MNLSMLLEMVAEGSGSRVVLGTRDDGFTAPQLVAAAQRAAGVFRSSGAGHVVLLDLNSEAVPIALFGAALAGLPFVPVNYRMKDAPLAAILQRVTPAVVVVGEDTAIRIESVPGLRAVRAGDLLSSEEEPVGDLPWVEPEGVAVLLFTSGTTGEPKAAVLRHRHLFSYILSTVEFMAAGPEEAQLVSVPPYHIAGMSSILSSLYAGRRVVYLTGFDPELWVRTAEKEAVTQAMVVPTMLGRILDAVEQTRARLPALRHLSYGGGRMPLETIERAMRMWPHVDFVNAYGLTETSSTVAVLSPDDHRRALASPDVGIRARLSSVGRAVPGVEITVRDAAGQALPAGQRGEVWVRGEQVAGEYLGGTLLNEEGWFATRDAGWLDSDGYLSLDGRLDDVIVRGGENLSPGEVEEVLLSHPAVLEAAVVGVPDSEWGETVAAAVVLRPGASADDGELRAWVRDRLRSTKTPQLIQFRAAMPYNETGKLLRRVIREELANSRREGR